MREPLEGIEVVLVQIRRHVGPRASERPADELTRDARQHDRLGGVERDVRRRLRLRQAPDAVDEDPAHGERRLLHLAHARRERRQRGILPLRLLRRDRDVVVPDREQRGGAEREAGDREIALRQKRLVAPRRGVQRLRGKRRRGQQESEDETNGMAHEGSGA